VNLKTRRSNQLTYKFLFFLFGVVLIQSACTSDTATSNPSPTSAEVIAESLHPDIDRLNQMIQSKPNNASLYAKRATVYFEKGQLAEAALDLEKAISIDSLQFAFHHLLADAYLDQNKSRLALNALKKAATIFPKRIPTLLKLSEFQIILAQNDEALQTIGRILKLDPQNAEGFFMMGMNFKDTGDKERAINSFQTAVENDPDLVDAWLELGVLFDERENPIASRYFDTALRIDSLNVNALEGMANHLALNNKIEDAIPIYEKITRIEPQYGNAYFNIGIMYMELGNFKKAYDQFNITTKIEPLHKMAYFYRGKASELQGNTKGAVADYQQVLNLDPQFQRATEALRVLNQ